MIKKSLYIVLLTGLLVIVSSFNYTNPRDTNTIIVQFVAVNGYGNNLYIDNVSFGQRPDYDVAVTSVNNLPKDTTYLNNLYTYYIKPEVNVTNFGSSSVLNDTVFMVINSVGYLSSDTTSVISPGETKTLTFDSLLISPGTTYDILVYIHKTVQDSNAYNDTLKQTSTVLLGAYRNVLVEEFTSMTSPSCAYNNPFLDRYIDSNFQSICVVKYHLGFPTPGIDSLYLADTLFQKQRANYYYVYAVPTTFLDGKSRLSLPYSYDSNLTIPFYTRFSVGSPLSLDVTDIRLPGDTIQTTININLYHTLGSNNLRLRVYAIERYKLYANAPGTNGEKNFYDIFRRAYPDSSGTLIGNIAGNYQYIYKYHIDSTWADSLIYTLAFVQDDNKKEVLNCAKSRQTPLYRKGIAEIKSPSNVHRKADLNNIITHIYKNNLIKNSDSSSRYFNFEGFEGPFPPPGWSILNPDVGFTYERLYNYNGPRFGGMNCIKVPFYDYPNIGERDTLLSVMFTGISPADSFNFDYSYAQYLSGYVDSLIVNLSSDGGATFINVFRRGGFSLATTSATTLSYAPVSSTQWFTFSYPMSSIFPLNPVIKVPESYRLYQNYPNPFNPKTNIKFDLPSNVFVNLRIYDILGREITTLLNEKMTAGPHSVEFSPVNLSSGVYFYRITAGDFSDVKKMVFIK